MTRLRHPYDVDGTGEWLRGNLHAHTVESDGVRSPAEVVADYDRRGYDFLAITDHDAFVDPADHREDASLCLLAGVEVSADGPHLLHVGADLDGPVDPERDRRRVLDAIADAGGFAVLNHPNWGTDFAHWSRQWLAALDGYAGVEVYNGVVERLPGDADATDRWDRLLSGRDLGGGDDPVWGFATDDAHVTADVGRGWTVAHAAERTPAAVVDALAAGRFYATTGVELREIAVDGGTIAVDAPDADRIRLVSDHGVVQQVVDGSGATFEVPADLVHGDEHTYVRVECLGRGGRRAWLQPMVVD